MHDEKVILQVNDLKKYFSLRKGFFSETKYIRAVDRVSFELYKGETLGIIGEVDVEIHAWVFSKSLQHYIWIGCI